MITEYLMLLDLPPTAILLIIMALIFLLAWPLEWVPIVLIIIPIVLPLIEQLGFNLTWFGILVAVIFRLHGYPLLLHYRHTF